MTRKFLMVDDSTKLFLFSIQGLLLFKSYIKNRADNVTMSYLVLCFTLNELLLKLAQHESSLSCGCIKSCQGDCWRLVVTTERRKPLQCFRYEEFPSVNRQRECGFVFQVIAAMHTGQLNFVNIYKIISKNTLM